LERLSRTRRNSANFGQVQARWIEPCVFTCLEQLIAKEELQQTGRPVMIASIPAADKHTDHDLPGSMSGANFVGGAQSSIW